MHESTLKCWIDAKNIKVLGIRISKRVTAKWIAYLITNMCVGFENWAYFRYFGTALTNQNCLYEEIKSRLNSPNACYIYVYSSSYSCFVSKCKTEC